LPRRRVRQQTTRASLADLMAGKELFLESRFEAYDPAT
jgi:hypothetical protein